VYYTNAASIFIVLHQHAVEEIGRADILSGISFCKQAEKKSIALNVSETDAGL
jgi:hypothetical protein